MRIGLNEDNKLTIAKFIKGLSSSIAHKVELKPYLFFNDVCHLAIKIEKKLKDRRPFPTPSPHQPRSMPKSFSSHNKVGPTLTSTKAFDKSKGIPIDLLNG